MEIRRSYCGLCHPRCGMMLHIENGRVLQITSNPILPDLFGVFESNTNMLCPDGPEFCSPEIGSWPHSALLCRIEKEQKPV